MVSSIRAERIADRIQRELSTLLVLEVSDPRLTSVFITDVTVDKELAFANIYVSSIEGSDAAPQILEGFKHARGYLRRELSRRITLRSFPQLRFFWDPVPERADRIDELLKSISDDEPEIPSDEEGFHLNG